MPYKTDRQRRFVRAKASEGVPWARKFAADSEIHKGALMTQTRYGNGGTLGRRIVDPPEPVDKAFGLPSLSALKTSAGKVGYKNTAYAAGSMLKPKLTGGLGKLTATPGRTLATIGTAGVAANLMGRRSAHKEDMKYGLAKYYDPENRRQRRLGAAEAGLGLSGGYVGFKGAKGVRETTRAGRKLTGVVGRSADKDATATANKVVRSGKGILVRRKNVAQLGGGALLLGGAGLVRQHAEGKHGRRAWN
jgi:hypothetical protein